MRQIHDKVTGPITITEDTELSGQINGDVTLESGIDLRVRGQLNGHLTVRPKAIASIFGQLNGDAWVEGRLTVSGMVSGSVRRVADAEVQVFAHGTIAGGLSVA
jgi:cytoskeletal protein CcmA (bactofilin family)